MPHPIDSAALQEILIVLGAVVIVIPLFHRLKFSPVLGFLLIGMVLGPTGLGALIRMIPGLDWVVITDRERIGIVAEFGVILLLFMIGLELSFERLMTMRKLVFGLGPLQVVLSAAAIATAAILLGESNTAAIVIGLALALSSTAVIVQVLSEENRLMSTTGRTTFAVLIFQDIAVVPILFGVAMLAGQAAGGLGGFALALGQAAIAVGLVIAAGRLVLRPLFRTVARSRSPELFMAACLLVLLGAATLTASAGLSMAMGALLAGLLLAETEYRRQIEVMLEPFKGLLLGVFLISTGMTIDVSRIAAAPALIVGLSVGLIVMKAAIGWAAVRLFGVSRRTAAQTALLLAPGGEFSLVVMASAAALGVVSGASVDIVVIVAALTMVCTPFLSSIGRALGERLTPKAQIDPALLAPADLGETANVVIAGYGRVGRVVADMLSRHGVSYLAYDADADVVARAREAGIPVYYGDMTRPDFLEHCGLGNARALVVTVDTGADVIVAAARKAHASLLIVARARDARHAARLYSKGATDAVPETIEASLLLSEALLVDIGVPMGPVIASIHDKRAEFRAEIQTLAPGAAIQSPPRQLLREYKRARRAPAEDAG
ncbi:MAG: cation:proton antiporter [Hyphomonadaceae bacterium]|nr:cation:proton antiporter [Hyphomonadaceae bacterium]